MATDTTQPEVSAAPAEEASASAATVPPGAAEPEAAQPAPTATTDKPVAGLDPIPPRIDGGGGVDEVLGEVSKMFGQAAGNSAGLATDEINEHLTGLGRTGSPAAAPAESAGEMALGTAAELFRSLPDSGSSGAEEAIDSEKSEPAKRAVEPIFGASKRAPATSAKVSVGVGRLRSLWARFPTRARVPAALVMTLLLGLFAGASLGRTHAHPASHAAAEEQTQAKTGEGSEETAAKDASKVAAIEEELQKALRERDAAHRDRALAIARLKEAQAARTGAPAKEQFQREQAARQAAEEHYHSAEKQLQLAQRRTYNIQLRGFAICGGPIPGWPSVSWMTPSVVRRRCETSLGAISAAERGTTRPRSPPTRAR